MFRKYSPVIYVAILLLFGLLLNFHSFNHEFKLDSRQGILNNSYIRSFRHIPDYFLDAGTLNSNRANGDYRPILQMTFALNYFISGYKMWSWQLLQILMHILVAVSLYFFCRKFILKKVWPEETDRERASDLSFMVALLFLIHPYTAGVVNYIWARSTLLVAVFLVPSFTFSLVVKGERDYEKISWWALLLYTLALFTKVEAVAALAVYFFLDISAGKGPFRDLISACNKRVVRRLAPFLLVTSIYFLMRTQVYPDFLEKTRQSYGMTTYSYLLTQLSACWHYISLWFYPFNMVADNLTFPISKSLFETRVLLALTGWLTVAAVLLLNYRRRPYLLYLGLSALALISPTSSFLPLSEMVNEHRPYLSLALLSMVWLLPLGKTLYAFFRQRESPGRLGLFSILAAALVISLASINWQRGQVYSTNESYWADIQRRAPSSRSLLNYGLVLMKKGDYVNARDHFLQALKLAPYWHVTHINLGISNRALGNSKLASSYFDQAVKYDHFSSEALVWRGEHYLTLKKYPQALQDFQASMPKAREYFRIYQGLSAAYAGLGPWRQALAYTKKCLALDAKRTLSSRKRIFFIFFARAELYRPGIFYYQGLMKILPTEKWVYQNIRALAAKIGDDSLVQEMNEKLK